MVDSIGGGSGRVTIRPKKGMEGKAVLEIRDCELVFEDAGLYLPACKQDFKTYAIEDCMFHFPPIKAKKNEPQ
jgi:hypothetical protein